MRVVGDIAGRAGEHLRRSVPERRFHVDDGGQRRPMSIGERLGGVARVGGVVGDDHRDGVRDAEMK